MGNNIDTFILLSEKKWHNDLFNHLQQSNKANWIRIDRKENFTMEKLSVLQPSKIFIPHWSYIIPAGIFNNYECIVFHMTDLPFGRGGSPLQNLIIRGLTKTKISAIKVTEGIDTGDVYLKKSLSLEGTAEEIFIRSAVEIEQMITAIINDKIVPRPQQGEVVQFKRRKPKDSNIQTLQSIDEVYDYIRMLDCEGYPKAFIETGFFKIEFNHASFKNNETITAHVSITKK